MKKFLIVIFLLVERIKHHKILHAHTAAKVGKHTNSSQLNFKPHTDPLYHHFFPSCFMSFSLEALPTLNQLIMLPWMHYSEFPVNSFTTLLYTRVASDSNDDVQTVQQLKFEWAELHTWCMILFNSFFFSQLTRTGTHVVACRW